LRSEAAEAFALFDAAVVDEDCSAGRVRWWGKRGRQRSKRTVLTVELLLVDVDDEAVALRRESVSTSERAIEKGPTRLTSKYLQDPDERTASPPSKISFNVLNSPDTIGSDGASHGAGDTGGLNCCGC
jgi:hypothetical protein